MKLRPLRTRLVQPGERDLFGFLTTEVKKIPERSILVVTSKIISFFEGQLISKETARKKSLIREEADYYLAPGKNRHYSNLSIRESAFIAAGGIDESNAAGQYVLLPRNCQRSTNHIRAYFVKRFGLKNFGIIVSDSRSIPLRRGAIGVALAWSGFRALKDYRGTTDLFGRTIQYEVANIADALAVAAVAVMGEGREQTPLALITELPEVAFIDRSPTKAERDFFFIQPKDDFFAPIFRYQNLKKGRHRP